MGHVEIAAQHHRLLFVQLHEVGPEVVLPLHPVVDAGQLVLGVGGVAADQEEAVELRGDDPALVVVRVQADAAGDGQGLHPGEHRRARVALLFRAVPEEPVAGQLQCDLVGLELGLLEADHVGVHPLEEVQKALAQACTQAVDVPGNQSHASPSSGNHFMGLPSLSSRGVRPPA